MLIVKLLNNTVLQIVSCKMFSYIYFNTGMASRNIIFGMDDKNW